MSQPANAGTTQGGEGGRSRLATPGAGPGEVVGHAGVCVGERHLGLVLLLPACQWCVHEEVACLAASGDVGKDDNDTFTSSAMCGKQTKTNNFRADAPATTLAPRMHAQERGLAATASKLGWELPPLSLLHHVADALLPAPRRCCAALPAPPRSTPLRSQPRARRWCGGS